MTVVFPNPEEVAVLVVNGQRFTDWETVMVRHSLYDHPWYHFRFTCSEGLPLAKNFAAIRIVPGMPCSVTLAGLPAVGGLVCSRQVFTDSKRHHIEIQGATNVMQLASAAAITQTGEFRDVSYAQFAKALLKPWPAMAFLEEGGKIPASKFPRISIVPGSSVLDALEEPLRALGGIALTSNVTGDLVAIAGPSGGSDTVYEGDLGRPSYIEGREIIYNPGMADGLDFSGQRPGTDASWGAAAAHVPFLGGPFSGFAGSGYSPAYIPLEIPAWSPTFLQGRSAMEASMQSSDQVTVFATVQGWLRPSGGLWQRNQKVLVNSPMLVLDGTEELTAKSVVFTQDDKTGTRTTLELCNALSLKGFTPQGPGGDS
jgi:prophage tail gpP-like protein